MLSSILSFVWSFIRFWASTYLTLSSYEFVRRSFELSQLSGMLLVFCIFFAIFTVLAGITAFDLFFKIMTFFVYIEHKKLGQAEEVEGYVEKRNHQKKNLFNQKWEVVLKYQDLSTTVNDERLYKTLREGDKVHLKVYTKKAADSVIRTLSIE